MSVQPFVLRPDEREPALNVVDTQVTVLASNGATQSYGVTLQQGEEGTGPPPHSHNWDEAVYILKGEIHFSAMGKTTHALWGLSCMFREASCMAFNMGKAVVRCLRLQERVR